MIGCIAPISLLAYIIETKSVSGRISAFKVVKINQPVGTNRQICYCLHSVFFQVLAGFQNRFMLYLGCNQMSPRLLPVSCALSAFISPLIARLSLSDAEPVKTISVALQFKNFATFSRGNINCLTCLLPEFMDRRRIAVFIFRNTASFFSEPPDQAGWSRHNQNIFFVSHIFILPKDPTQYKSVK